MTGEERTVNLRHVRATPEIILDPIPLGRYGQTRAKTGGWTVEASVFLDAAVVPAVTVRITHPDGRRLSICGNAHIDGSAIPTVTAVHRLLGSATSHAVSGHGATHLDAIERVFTYCWARHGHAYDGAATSLHIMLLSDGLDLDEHAAWMAMPFWRAHQYAYTAFLTIRFLRNHGLSAQQAGEFLVAYGAVREYEDGPVSVTRQACDVIAAFITNCWTGQQARALAGVRGDLRPSLRHLNSRDIDLAWLPLPPAIAVLAATAGISPSEATTGLADGNLSEDSLRALIALA